LKIQANRTSNSGFTIIELLVAMTITSVIVLVLLNIVSQSSATYTNTLRAVNSISESRSFLYFIDTELSSRLPGTPLIHQAGKGDDPTSSDKLAFIRALTVAERNANAGGDLGTSVYYVAFSPSSGNAVIPRLHRKILSPSETQSLLENQGDSTLLSPDIINDEIILDNILSFKAQQKVINPVTGELENWIEATTQSTVAIELTIRFIDESYARRLTTTDDWNSIATSPKDIELPYIRNYSRTISVKK